MLDPLENVIAASPNCFFDFSPFVAYAYLAKAGIKYVEVPCLATELPTISPELLTDEDVTHLKERLTSIGVQAASIGAYCDLLVPRQVEALRCRIDFAQKLGAGNVVSDATHQLELGPDDYRKLVNTLRYLGDYAADRGVKIALETHGGLTRNGANAARLLSAVDHPAVGANYDTGNIYYYNDDLDPAEDVRQVAEKVIQVHLKDTAGGKGEWLFCALGDGRVAFPSIIRVLQSAGFRGPYSLELEGKRGEDLNREGNLKVVEHSLSYLRRIGLMPQA
jgi:L-ribulose-5-phosphate 3-epimerase